MNKILDLWDVERWRFWSMIFYQEKVSQILLRTKSRDVFPATSIFLQMLQSNALSVISNFSRIEAIDDFAISKLFS